MQFQCFSPTQDERDKGNGWNPIEIISHPKNKNIDPFQKNTLSFVMYQLIILFHVLQEFANI